MEVDEESCPNLWDVWDCRAAFCPGRHQVLRFRFMVFLFFVHAEEGVLVKVDGDGMFVGAAEAVACVQ